VHAKYLLLDESRDREAIEAIDETFPEFDRVPVFA
jgi:hypothetical protein